MNDERKCRLRKDLKNLPPQYFLKQQDEFQTSRHPIKKEYIKLETYKHKEWLLNMTSFSP